MQDRVAPGLHLCQTRDRAPEGESLHSRTAGSQRHRRRTTMRCAQPQRGFMMKAVHELSGQIRRSTCPTTGRASSSPVKRELADAVSNARFSEPVVWRRTVKIGTHSRTTTCSTQQEADAFVAPVPADYAVCRIRPTRTPTRFVQRRQEEGGPMEIACASSAASGRRPPTASSIASASNCSTPDA
jgi:hypothetical protein